MLFRLETLLVVLCLLAIVAIRRGRVWRATGWIGSVIAVIVAISVWPLGNLVLAPLERAHPASPALGYVQGIIVLGGAEYDGTLHSEGVAQVNSAGDRFIAAMELAHRFPDARVLWSGGRATIAGSAEAYSSGVEILLRMGLAEERLLVDDTVAALKDRGKCAFLAGPFAGRIVGPMGSGHQRVSHAPVGRYVLPSRLVQFGAMAGGSQGAGAGEATIRSQPSECKHRVERVDRPAGLQGGGSVDGPGLGGLSGSDQPGVAAAV